MSTANRSIRRYRLLPLPAAVLGAVCAAHAGDTTIGDGPVIRAHMEQAAIEDGRVGFGRLFEHGRALFVAKFNEYDGQGRPAATGAGAPRSPDGQPLFIRTSGPDSNSCAGCHNDPFVGGAGDNVANVFVLAQALDPVTDSVSAEFSNERSTLGMHGSGAIEMLAREMTAELQARRDAALEGAARRGRAVRIRLRTKGVDFGELEAFPDGSVDGSAIAGIDADLVVRPFHQKGAVVSLREFSNNAMNHHHGMQSVERFGAEVSGTDDHDADGVPDELTVGDITAVTIFQAALGIPGQVFPDSHAARKAVMHGERAFREIGCVGCHRPSLELDSSWFSEPNPYNPPGNLVPAQVTRSFAFDLTRQGEPPRLTATSHGTIRVRAWTDLKRHDLCDEEMRHFCNEQVIQAGIPTEHFLTRKLWDVGNTAPYGHRGDLTTLTGAIAAHGGEAREARLAFEALPAMRQDEVIEFLKSLQILPPGTLSLSVDTMHRPLDRATLARLAQMAEE